MLQIKRARLAYCFYGRHLLSDSVFYHSLYARFAIATTTSSNCFPKHTWDSQDSSVYQDDDSLEIPLNRGEKFLSIHKRDTAGILKQPRFRSPLRYCFTVGLVPRRFYICIVDDLFRRPTSSKADLLATVSTNPLEYSEEQRGRERERERET